MCGVFGYIGKKDEAAQIVFEGIKTLEYRGYDSWGEAIWTGKKFKIVKKTGRITGGAPKVKSNLALGHTRWATHGGVTKINTHPHADCKGRLVVVHNGIIENFDSLKKELVGLGHKFISDTDTEVAAHLIEEKLKEEKDFWQAFSKAFRLFEGLNAIVAIDSYEGKIYAAKNGSPLVVGLGKKENFIASDSSALLPQTKKVVFLEDNQGVIIDKDKVEFWDLIKRKKIKPKSYSIFWSTAFAARGKFAHFMLKEIHEQPQVLRDIIENSSRQIEKLAEMIKKSYGTYFVGCGTAGHAALFGQYLFSKVACRHVNFSYGSEFGFLADFLTERSLVVALSQSGETIDIIEAIDKARNKGAKIGALVNVVGSTLYRKADYRLMLMAGPEKAVASTKAFCAKLALLIMLANCLNGGLKRARRELKDAVGIMDGILEKGKIIKKLAKKIHQSKDIYIIGRGLSYPLALETALKIKEISYIHAEGFAAGELKHGVIALIEKGTPCIVFAPDDDAYGAVMSGAMELAARGGYIIGVSEKNRADIFDYHIPLFDTGVSTVVNQAVVGQLIAYFLALYRGCEIDKPRNLAKSVTVK